MLYLLPEPGSLRMDEGSFTMSAETRIVLDRVDSSMMRTMAQQLQKEIEHACGVRLPVLCGQARPGDISLAYGPVKLPVRATAVGAYALEIAPEGVTVRGTDASAQLWGVQTLRQIVRQCGWTLPALTIEDAPVFEHRGFYHDVTRGRIPTLAWLRQLADEMCLYKLNQLQLYVEHTYLFRDLTELYSTAGTPLTAEEILELREYCASRGIELVPSLSSFGHLFELLRTKRFLPLCERTDAADMPSTMPNRMAHHTIDPTNPESLKLVTAMIDEYLPLFSSPYFNICADETFDLGKDRNQGKEERTLYMGFVKALCEHVASKGRIPMFWGDIVLKFPEALSELPPQTICLNWGYSADVREDSTRILAQAGAKQYVCPGVSSWNQWIPRIRTSYENIRRMAEYGVKYGAEGLLNTDWGDYGHISDPRFSLPGLIFGACAAWNGALPECDELMACISRLTYGDCSGKMVACMAALSEAQVYGWWSLVRRKDWAQGVLEGAGDVPPMQSQPEEKLAEADEAIRAAEEVLRSCCLSADVTARPVMARLLGAAEAIRLWNCAGHAVSCGRKDVALAKVLEGWLYRYEQSWREVSKESELWRIRDVTVWYACQLR